MTFQQQSLSTKIVWIAVVLMMVALTAVGFTLFESWKFEGGAAAVNDLGSERMRSYRIAFLLSESLRDTANSKVVRGELTREMKVFEDMLESIKRGDPARPLFLPRNPDIANEMDALAAQWHGEIRPAVEAVLADSNPQAQREQATALRPSIEQFVQRIDRLVRAIERHIAHNIAYLRYMQFGLIMLAVAGTVALIYLMFLLVVNPGNQTARRHAAHGEGRTRHPSADRIQRRDR